MKNSIKSLLLAVPISVLFLLSGCSRIIQPDREDLIKAAQEQMGQPVELDISFDFVDDNLALYYNTEVTQDGSSASWEGNATVYYLDYYFKQDCITICDGLQSCKQWKDKWVASETVSPCHQINEWLNAILKGEGVYLKQPVVPSEISESLEGLENETYCIHLKSSQIDWSSLVDFQLDSLFGGDELLEGLSQGNIYFFFDCDSLALDSIYITRISDIEWFEATIDINSSSEHPEQMPEQYETIEGILSEDWNIAVAE